MPQGNSSQVSASRARWLKGHAAAGREIWLWGAGRVTRQRFRILEAAGIHFTGFIDVDAKKLGCTRDGRPVVGPEALPDPARAFIVAGVGTRGARELIAAGLRRYGWQEDKDYLFAA